MNQFKGKLEKEEYKCDIVYYVRIIGIGNIRLSPSLKNTLGYKLDELIGSEVECNLIDWDYITPHPEVKYRVNEIKVQ